MSFKDSPASIKVARPARVTRGTFVLPPREPCPPPAADSFAPAPVVVVVLASAAGAALEVAAPAAVVVVTAAAAVVVVVAAAPGAAVVDVVVDAVPGLAVVAVVDVDRAPACDAEGAVVCVVAAGVGEEAPVTWITAFIHGCGVQW